MTNLLHFPGLAHPAGRRDRLLRQRPRAARLGAALLLSTAALSGCVSVPQLGARPEPLAPAAVAAERSLAAAAGAQWPGEGWWRDYGDPQLDGLITEGLANSPDVAAAAARFRKAGALAQQAGAARLPRLDGQGQVQLERQSLNMGFPASLQAFLPQGWNDGGQVAANLGFDLDLWGRNRAAYAAARSEVRAAALDERQARLALAAGIASAYVDLARLFDEREVRRQQLDSAAASRRLVAERQANGLETRGGLAASDAQVATARIALGQAEEALALRRNQIAALIGAGPDRGLALTQPALRRAAPRALPDGVTTDLVGRRADVIAARERVEAAASRIKVARADFFPALRLGALIGFQSLGLDMLFDRNSSFGRVGPALSLPIFHGGELQGRYRGARADYDSAVAGYDGTVLAAYQQVADALTVSRLAEERLADARAALAASEEAHDVMRARYKGGLATYLDVLQLEDRLLQARLAVSGLEAVVRNADVALVRALGGGLVGPSAATIEEQVHD